MKTARLNRLFNPKSRRCFDVAIDHGFFNEGSFLSGIEDLPNAVATLVEAGPDAIQLTVGQAPHLQGMPVRAKPALVLRTDVANVYGPRLPAVLFSRMIAEPVVQALRLDAGLRLEVVTARPLGLPPLLDVCVERLEPGLGRCSIDRDLEPWVEHDLVRLAAILGDHLRRDVAPPDHGQGRGHQADNDFICERAHRY